MNCRRKIKRERQRKRKTGDDGRLVK